MRHYGSTLLRAPNGAYSETRFALQNHEKPKNSLKIKFADEKCTLESRPSSRAIIRGHGRDKVHHRESPAITSARHADVTRTILGDIQTIQELFERVVTVESNCVIDTPGIMSQGTHQSIPSSLLSFASPAFQART